MNICVPERGSVAISEATWSTLASDHRFWKLVEGNVLRVEAHRHSWRLHGTCYVGRAVFGSVVVEVVEKFSGAFATLAAHARPKAPKLTRAQSPITDTPSSMAVLVELFLLSARSYLSGFQLVEYEQTAHKGATVSGRLDVRNTVKLRSRGIRHQVAFQRSELTIDLPINQVVYAALNRVEHLSADLTQQQVSMARALRHSLSPCDVSAKSKSLAELGQVAATEADNPGLSRAAREVSAFAGAILDTAGFGGDGDWTRVVDRSWFVNLEWLFEEAVRNVAGELLGTAASVDRGGRTQPLFRPDHGRYRANPDLVIRAGSNVFAVGDAKYKELAGWPSASDVYEVLAHTTAYGAANSLMIYPGQGYSTLDLGAAGAQRLRCFTVGLDTFVESMGLVLEQIGLSLAGNSPSKGVASEVA